MKPITIIGGGLAGLTLGLALRQRGVPVTLVEAGHYPRHRVCGEFISGRGQRVLTELGLRDELRSAGARLAERAAFFTGRGQDAAFDLPEPALCVSRHVLDAFLAQRFTALGGELRCDTRWSDSFAQAGLVRATGRRARPLEDGWRWFGLKAHGRGVPLSADLEMHLLDNAYVGMCRVSDDTINVCGLFRSRAGAGADHRTIGERLRGPSGTPLHERLADAIWDEASFTAVAGLDLRPEHASESGECRIGDAVTMIPPVTGNGMSMAFESAWLAVEPLTAYARGETDWDETRGAVARVIDRAFGPRLRWAGWLQWALFQPWACRALVAATQCSRSLWPWWFRVTR